MTSRVRKTAAVLAGAMLAGVMLAGVMALISTVASAQSPDTPLQLEAKILLGSAVESITWR